MQDSDPEPSEPASISSSQSVEVKMEALWWYGNSGMDGESVESGSVVDDQTAVNRIVGTSGSENAEMGRFVIIFCYINDLCGDKALFFNALNQTSSTTKIVVFL